MNRPKVLAVFALALLSSVVAPAQTTGAATLVGTVTDTTDAVMPGVKVIVVNSENGFTFDGVTNNEGYYYIPYLRPGTYNLTIQAQGFKKYVRQG
ncbi:MAG: carboxypeptidase-like regulatory domain-containing protein, partial [Acidobacteriota bacterium]|nr:carboxypeptidase-like regulatory domain-containing protein [Acidobacteriota bacterium]